MKAKELANQYEHGGDNLEQRLNDVLYALKTEAEELIQTRGDSDSSVKGVLAQQEDKFQAFRRLIPGIPENAFVVFASEVHERWDKMFTQLKGAKK